MTALTERMTADALARQQSWVNRSCGQRKRQVKASFAEIMPTREDLSQVEREPGEIEFVGVEPEIEPAWYFKTVNVLWYLVSVAFTGVSVVWGLHWWLGA